MKKRGITLLALLITIIVSLIIVSASIVSVANIVENNRISSFAEKMKTLEEQVTLYYIENNEIPKLDNTLYNKSEIIAMVNNYNDFDVAASNSIEEELNLNHDSNASAFYKLDLSKINVSRTDSEEYVIAIPSLHVYSLKAMSARNKEYFSISSKINSSIIVRENNQSYDDTATITSVNGVRVSQKSSNWSNKLQITIESFIEENEELYVKFNEKEVMLSTVKNKQNSIYFDSLVQTDVNGLKVSANSQDSFEEEDMLYLSSLDVKEKRIQIIKKDTSNNIVASVDALLFNFDYNAPSIENLNNNVKSENDKNIIEFYVSDSQSGIKEIRYDYFSTYDRNDGNEGRIAYYSIDKITRKYLVYNGKLAKPDINGKVTIDIPKGISSIKLVILDNAENVSDAIELNTAGEKEVYYSTSDITSDGLKVKFYGDNLISGNFQYSFNNISYSDSIAFNPSQNLNIKFNSDSTKLYIKVDTGEITRNIEIDLEGIEFNGTNIKSNSKWYNPYIPNGFIHTEGSVNQGFVIQDVSENGNSKYNEFVWIPVDGRNVKYGRYEFGIGTIATFQNVLIDNKGSFVETSNYEEQIKESISKYGGFYVARYEASSDLSGNVKSVKNAVPSTSMSYENALNKSNLVYQNNNDIVSTLMTAGCYDTTMKYLSLSKYNVTTKTEYNTLLGNFSGNYIKTGSNNNYALNNIYDICGNVSEMTTETYKGKTVFRGGSYSSTGDNMVGAVRAYNDSTVELPTIGFRVIMFIK